VLTHLLLGDLKKSAASEDGDARVVVITSSLHDVEFSKKRGRKFVFFKRMIRAIASPSFTTISTLTLISTQPYIRQVSIHVFK